jgi:hypothetical protein
VRTRRSLLVIAALAASLVVPVGAQAQSAGDEQYTDPFSQSEPPSQGQQQGSTGQAPSQPATPAQSSGQAPAEAAPAQQAPAQLPRTGFAAALTAAYGCVLLLAGFAIRRRV